MTRATPPRWSLRAVALGALVLSVASVGCRGDGPRGAEHARPVDEALLVALEQARALQHRADIHLGEGEVAAAVADVEEVLKVTFPHGAPEGEEARLDAWARLAKLRLAEAPASAEAEARGLADVARGEAEATRDSFYRAHLATVAGEIYEARGRRLGASDAAGSRAAMHAALAAYARSIEIDKRVQAALARQAP